MVRDWKSNPNGVASMAAEWNIEWRRALSPDTTPLGLDSMGGILSQGSEFLATLGFETRSLWDGRENAQNESSPLETNSFFTDAILPFRKSLFNSSFALPCPFAGIWMNSNAMSDFYKNFASRGFAPTSPLSFSSFVIRHSSFVIRHSSFVIRHFFPRSTSLPAFVPHLATPFRCLLLLGD
jgi:hypothetical protein